MPKVFEAGELGGFVPGPGIGKRSAGGCYRRFKGLEVRRFFKRIEGELEKYGRPRALRNRRHAHHAAVLCLHLPEQIQGVHGIKFKKVELEPFVRSQLLHEFDRLPVGRCELHDGALRFPGEQSDIDSGDDAEDPFGANEQVDQVHVRAGVDPGGVLGAGHGVVRNAKGIRVSAGIVDNEPPTGR
jgi:hypothetical protein